jgi:hypothetical protein
MRLAIIAAFAMLTLTFGVSSGHAQSRRVALLIGNSAYQSVPALPNPINDAIDVGSALERLGFTVKRMTNARFDDIRRALIDFGQQARGAEMAVVFFSGHGMETGGENWLIPVDAKLNTDLDIENETIGLKAVTRTVSNATKLGLVILDACRNNPFAAKMQRTNITRSVDRGFTRVEPAENVLVAYAARDGTTASDGRGRNSPFTTALLNNLEKPGLEITFLFRNVRDEVMAATRREQQPFLYGSLSKEEIFLRAPADGAASNRPGDDPAGAAWAEVRNTTNIALLENFIQYYGNSFYATLGRERIEELKKREVVVVPRLDLSPSPAIDPGVVGTWETQVPNNRGVARWVWNILPGGTYRFHSEGPGAVSSHEGTITLSDGHWTLRALRGLRGWEDGGPYEFRDANTLIMTGRLGTGIWHRIDAYGAPVGGTTQRGWPGAARNQ